MTATTKLDMSCTATWLQPLWMLKVAPAQFQAHLLLTSMDLM